MSREKVELDQADIVQLSFDFAVKVVEEVNRSLGQLLALNLESR